MGQNLASIAAEVGVEVGRLSTSLVIAKMKYSEVPDNQKWRLPILEELMDDSISIPGFIDSEIILMRNHICTS